MDEWYGIPGIRFIWHGCWSDPELEYKGVLVNSTLIEDSMWEDYTEDCRENGVEANDDAFSQYMRDSANTVYDLLDMTINAIKITRRYDYVRGEIDNIRSILDYMVSDLDDSESESDEEDKETYFEVVGDHIDILIEKAKQLKTYIKENTVTEE